ncbi:unnamed protein product [Thelazia callipaeda]|uniref:H/ACA ribonucleoprotein complex subunit n=1 Tax=Thelazia callipaeda TaxID=103827 RepID=A0A0N5CKU4_THECL|nr:unnamed protein product [Thelazia callipaeda]
MLLQHEDEDDLDPFLQKASSEFIEHEYDALPPIEELRIHVDEDVPLIRLGAIVSIFFSHGSESFTSEYYLNIYIFQVYDIFGPVSKPLYAILFNDVQEANQWKVGSAMYYAPSATQFTFPVFMEKLKQEKVTDSCWDGDGECPDELLTFSDDEAEKQYKAKHRSSNKIGDLLLIIIFFRFTLIIW